MAKFMIVGTATDGPSYMAMDAPTERGLLSLLGANYTQRTTIAATASSLQLTYTPMTGAVSNVFNNQSTFLFQPTVSGSVLYFGSVGVTGGQLDVSYTPYTGESDLVWSVRKWVDELGAVPCVMRVGGSNAQLTAGSWTFVAKYAGAKYNSVTLSYTGGVLTIGGLEPMYPELTYNYSVSKLGALIARDFELGLCPVYVQSASAYMGDFAEQNLSGGADGVMDSASITNYFEYGSIPNDVSHVLFLTPLTSSFISRLSTEMGDTFYQPRLHFFPVPTYTSPSTSYVQSLATTLPYRHAMVCGVLGTVQNTLRGVQKTRYAAESVVRGFVQSNSTNLTNVAIVADSYDPLLTEDELSVFKANGIVTVSRHVLRDLATYEGVVTGLNQTFLFSSKVAEVHARASSYLHQFLGYPLPDGPQPLVAENVRQRLASITWISNVQVDCQKVTDILYCSIQADMPGEILTITFTVKTNVGGGGN